MTPLSSLLSFLVLKHEATRLVSSPFLNQPAPCSTTWPLLWPLSQPGASSFSQPWPHPFINVISLGSDVTFSMRPSLTNLLKTAAHHVGCHSPSPYPGPLSPPASRLLTDHILPFIPMWFTARHTPLGCTCPRGQDSVSLGHRWLSTAHDSA